MENVELESKTAETRTGQILLITFFCCYEYVFDFSSAFNTIQLAVVDKHMAAWAIDFLTNRPQYVRLKDCVSDVVTCSTGGPQGMVLIPFLFTIYNWTSHTTL